MIFHDSAQSYLRPEVNIGVRHNPVRRGARDLPGGELFWKTFGRMALAVVVVTIGANLLLGAYKEHLVTVATAFEGQRHELVDGNITLRATRAGMLTRQAVEAAAGKALSLYSPSEGQRLVYNRDKGRFDKL